MRVHPASCALSAALLALPAAAQNLPQKHPQRPFSNASSYAEASLPAVTVAASGVEDGADDGDALARRTVPLESAAATASRLEAPIKDIPASVEVLGRAAMQSRGDRTVLEAAEKAAGLSASHTPGSPGSFSARGFASGVSWLYNGLPIPGGTGMSSRLLDTGNLARIEVLRGPSSVLHGAWGTGAVVNLITREASFERQRPELDYSLGSHRAHRLHLGAGGALKADTLAWRLDYAGAHAHSPVQAERTVKNQLNASLLARFSARLRLTLALDHASDNARNVYYGTPLINGRLAGALRHINYNQLEDGIFKARNTWLRVHLQWDAAPGWQVDGRLYALKGFSDWRNIENFAWLGGAAPASQRVQRSSWVNLDHHRDLIGGRLDVLRRNQIAGRPNRLLAGVDLSRLQFASWRNDFGGRDEVSAWQPPVTRFGSVGRAKTPARETTVRQASLYLEDLLEITPQLKLMTGLRHERIQGRWLWLDRSGHPQARKTHRYTAWRAGVVYEAVPDLHLYASLSTAAEPGGTLLLANPQQSQLRLTTARQAEIGVKQSLWEGRGEWTVALYDIRKRNVFVPDPQRPADRIAIGQQSSRGLELTAAWRPAPQWQLQANAAWVRARYDDYQSGNPPVSYNGHRPPMTPALALNLGLGWRPAPAWRFDAWLRRLSRVYVNDANTATLPAYATLDLSAAWQASPQTEITFRVRNATNALYAHAVYYSGTQAMLAPPRSYEIGVKWRF